MLCYVIFVYPDKIWHNSAKICGQNFKFTLKLWQFYPWKFWQISNPIQTFSLRKNYSFLLRQLCSSASPAVGILSYKTEESAHPTLCSILDLNCSKKISSNSFVSLCTKSSVQWLHFQTLIDNWHFNKLFDIIWGGLFFLSWCYFLATLYLPIAADWQDEQWN